MRKLLLAQYAPAAVLIDRKFEIRSLFGPTSNYLELPSGEPTKDLMALAPPSLRIEGPLCLSKGAERRRNGR